MIALSLGHGGGDGGARANGTTENAEVTKVAEQAQKILATQGVQIVLVPDGTLAQRIKWINSNKIEMVIELHLDSAPGASGCTLFYYDGFNQVRDSGKPLLDTYSQYSGIKSRGMKPDSSTRHGRLGIIRDTKPTAYLLELGFIQNDLETVRTKSAVALAQAILQYLNKPLMTEIQLQEWEKKALEYAKNSIGFSQANPRTAMTRVEVAETMRKFEAYIASKYSLK